MDTNESGKRKMAIKPLGSGNRTSSASRYKDKCTLIDLSLFKILRMEKASESDDILVVAEGKPRSMSHSVSPGFVTSYDFCL